MASGRAAQASAMTPLPGDEDSVGSSVYEGLVRLTFLCGRGLPLPELMQRFLVAMQPHVPAEGLWLYDHDQLVAHCNPSGLAVPPPPPALPANLAAMIGADGLVRAHVLPHLGLVVRAQGEATARTRDVVTLQARLLAMAWYSETRPDPEITQDDYQTAKKVFKQRWLRALLTRHPSPTAAAQAAGISRASLYAQMEKCGIRRDASHNG